VLVLPARGAPKDADVTHTVARRAGEYRASTLAEPTTERGIGEARGVIIGVLYVEHQAMSRRVYQPFEC
jgi:hypothetical protein